MINYHKILEMHLQGISQRTISSSTGHSRDKIREVVNQAKAKGLEELSKEMNNPWLEDYLFLNITLWRSHLVRFIESHRSA